MYRLICTFLLGVGVLSPSAASAVGMDWPALRGDGTGHGQLSSEIANAESLKLQRRWKKSLGSGFASVVVSGEQVFAMYSDDTSDRLVSLNASTGDSEWSVKLGPKFIGKNGSFDGPLSTPIVFEGAIYTLTGYGILNAYRVTDGQQLWSINLVEAHDAVTPLYGFATSPVISRDTLVVQHGAQEAAVMGIDPRTGDVKWKAGSGPVNSQSPGLIRFGEAEIVACCCGKQVFGIDAETGQVRFEFTHGGGNGSAMVPVQIADDALLLTNDDSFSEAFRLETINGEIQARPYWKERSIKNTYNIPCATPAGLLAFSTRILTCVDPITGRAKWKSREPGDGFLVSAGKWICIGTKEGTLHLAEINDQAYREVSHIDLFEDVMWSVPAISNDAVFLRSLGEIARVDLVPVGERIVLNEGETVPLSSGFNDFLQQLSRAENNDARDAMIDRYMDEAKTFPIVEDGIAHFVYRGSGTDVAVACDAFGARQEQPMLRVPETNLFYYGLKLPASQRMNYVYLVDYQPTLDPLNPRTMTSTVYAGEMEFAARLRNDEPLQMSWFGMSDFHEPAYMAMADDELKGRVEQLDLKVTSSSDPYSVSVYLPPSYNDQSKKDFPVVFIFDAVNSKARGQLPEAMDRMFELKMAPSAILVFLEDGPGRDASKFADVMADEILPALNERFRIDERPSARICWGANFTAGSALGVLVARPDAFGAAAIQSPLVFDDAREAAAAALRTIDRPINLYLEWGRFDMFNPVENWDVRVMSQEFVDAVKENPNVTLTGGQVDDTTDWSSWRNRYDVVLKTLLNN